MTPQGNRINAIALDGETEKFNSSTANANKWDNDQLFQDSGFL
jgi:hypothetical protein